jgi:competence protein ComEC
MVHTNFFNARKYPFVRLLAPFVAGILLAEYFPFLKIDLYCVLASLLLLITYYIYFRRKVEASQLGFTFLLSLFLLLSGYYYLFCEKNAAHFSFSDKEVTVLAQVTQKPIARNEGFRTTLKIEAIRQQNQWINLDEQVAAWFSDTLQGIPENSSHIICQCKIQPVKEPENPGTFNYKKYLARNGIFNQTFVNKWVMADNLNKNHLGINELAGKYRDKLSQIFVRYGFTNDQTAIAAAMSVGEVAFLTSDLKLSYSRTGAMHILSVSGMHVGIVFGILLFLFSFIKIFERKILIRNIIIIIIIWLYALLTGFSPSVIRSSLMFSMLALGTGLKRHSDSMNTLAAAAFILLIDDPQVLFHVSFQLSFLAVAGILMFQPMMNKWYCPKNKFSKMTWNLFTISFAAQLVTTPISLFQFHQFPNYFFITNMLAVPLSTLVLWLSIPFLAVSGFYPLAFVLAKILAFLLDVLNAVIRFIDQLPGAVSSNIGLSLVTVCCLYLILWATYINLKQFSKSWIFIALIGIIMLITNNIYTYYTHSSDNEIVVFKSKGEMLLGLMHNGKHLLLAENKNDIKLNTNEYWINKGEMPAILEIGKDSYSANNVTIRKIGSKSTIIQLDEKILVLLNDTLNSFPSEYKDITIIKGQTGKIEKKVMKMIQNQVICQKREKYEKSKDYLAELSKTGAVTFTKHSPQNWQIKFAQSYK